MRAFIFHFVWHLFIPLGLEMYAVSSGQIFPLVIVSKNGTVISDATKQASKNSAILVLPQLIK